MQIARGHPRYQSKILAALKELVAEDLWHNTALPWNYRNNHELAELSMPLWSRPHCWRIRSSNYSVYCRINRKNSSEKIKIKKPILPIRFIKISEHFQASLFQFHHLKDTSYFMYKMLDKRIISIVRHNTGSFQLSWVILTMLKIDSLEHFFT